MDKKECPWTDCLTQLSWDQVIENKKTKKYFSLVLVHRKDGIQQVNGTQVALHYLSENAFYFWFKGVYLGESFVLKIKQNVVDRENRYVQEISLGAADLLEKKNTQGSKDCFDEVCLFWAGLFDFRPDLALVFAMKILTIFLLVFIYYFADKFYGLF